ncbi:SGNH/GDSL hydrolase family protein [Yeosuana marina]|uniref:SGNH/GDSL hydrolase family protein n=1 Tax=Yeosuana marina TaxID=1565536 RepID=UPI0030EF48A5|tara:strand:- start:329 stop:1012 length:684 start_codon:yes stop_codon:yes gene_type:complete
MRYFKLFLLSIILLFINQNLYAQDWANMNKFQKANTELMNSNITANRVVFMGNSITEGWSVHHPEFFQNQSYINRGISGQTTPQMLLRFRQDVIDLNPSAVVILAGINDIAQNTGPISIEMIFGNIKSMVELSRANHIKVVLCSVLPANSFPWRPSIIPTEKVIKLNDLLKSYALANNIIYVDYFSAMADASNGLKKELGIDTVHPNKEGYLVMEPLIEEALKKALN